VTFALFSKAKSRRFVGPSARKISSATSSPGAESRNCKASATADRAISPEARRRDIAAAKEIKFKVQCFTAEADSFKRLLRKLAGEVPKKSGGWPMAISLGIPPVRIAPRSVAGFLEDCV
jgi:hypothetical protein